MKLTNFLVGIAVVLVMCISSCEKDEDYSVVFDDTEFDTSDWTEATHAKGADPDYDEVFSDTEVKRLDFVITSERWEGMLIDMENKYGSLGSSGGRPGLVETDEKPIFVPGEVYFQGKQWYKVGLRFKGNSSLQSAWGSGLLKLSFKMDFDEFEDEYPQVENQRFYGFKKFSLKNNFNDPSMMREKVGSDIFRRAGVASSRTSFYTLYVDHGSGPEYFGLYTLVEEIDNTVIKTQFSSDEGNVYKPDGTVATFALGTFNSSEFEKKTNEDDADWSDVERVFATLHSSVRTSSSATWRRDLNDVFDTETFLKYLAVNTTIQNWDTYGRMTHNYYLYNNPENGLLTWVPWDNNEAFQAGKQGGSYALNFSGLSSDTWPMIGFLYADPVYKAQYDGYLEEVINGAFEANTMSDLYSTYSDLIEPFATTERVGYSFISGPADFYSGVSAMQSHVVSRATAVRSYLQ
ncbi:MAG: CotH kinase family protein [Saprospiraceae bacterium]